MAKLDPSTGARLLDAATGARLLCSCCSPWYLLAEPCSYGDKGDCLAQPKANVYLCVDAKDQDGVTIRERFGAFPVDDPDRCFTFVWAGWCYSTCYKELDESGETASVPPEGELFVACGETVTVVETDCEDAACPQGDGYIEAVVCDGTQAEDGPRIFICAGAVTHRFIFRMVNDPPLFNGDICYCVTPGDGISGASIPGGAMRIEALDFASTPGWVEFDNNLNSLHYTVPVYTSCCGCLAGCNAVDLRGDELNPCCCGEEPSIIDYNVDFTFRRTGFGTGGLDSLTYTGRGSGTSGPYATLPYDWTSTSVVDGVTTVTTDTPEWTPPGALCGFLEGNGWPPATFVDAQGGSLSDTIFDFTDTVAGLNPIGASDPAGTGQWVGETNASCASISITVTGTVVASDGTTDEVTLNVYLFIDRDADARCTGVCDGPEEFFGSKEML